MKKLFRFAPLLLLIVGAGLAIHLGVLDYLSLEALRTHQATLKAQIEAKPVITTVLFCLSYIGIVALSIPGATLMTLLGGFLLGQWLGTLAVVLSATIGATFVFMSARFAVGRNHQSQWVEKMRQGFQTNAFNYLLTLRLIPLFPFFAINLVAGLLKVATGTFISATILGIIPGSFVYVSAGVALESLLSQPEFSLAHLATKEVIIALTGLGLLSILPVIYRAVKAKQSTD